MIPRYSRPEMTALWEPQMRFRIWFEIEAHAADAQAELVCSAPVARRAQILDLLPQPEEVIPRLPEAELCFTVKAVGLESATWILEHATPDQLVACLDLDAWQGDVPDPGKLGAWLEALG